MSPEKLIHSYTPHTDTRAEDPTILSGTLRSTLDVFDEYEDAQIVRQYEPLPVYSLRGSLTLFIVRRSSPCAFDPAFRCDRRGRSGH